MIPPTLYIVAGAAFAGLLGGWTIRDWKADSEALGAANLLIETKDEMQGKLDAKASAFESFRASIEPQRIEGRTIIEKEYRNVPVPADCALRPDALGVLEQARLRANAAAAGQSGEPLPDGAADPGARP